MKKLMIAAAIVCAAAVSQAAQFNWSTGESKAFGVSPASVTDNGNYAASTAKADRVDKCTLGYILAIYSGDTLIGTQSGDVEQDTGIISTFDIDIASAAASTTYNYVLTISGSQNSLSAKTSDTYDYSGATISTILSGSVTTAAFGCTDLTTDVPTSWAVADITKKDTPVPSPEPTSAMLMLLGVAGLALRRKQK